MKKKRKTIEELASNIVKNYVCFDDHVQYIAGEPAQLKKDIIKALQEQEKELLKIKEPWLTISAIFSVIIAIWVLFKINGC